MKFISCKACGVVLDAEVLPYDQDFYEEDGHGGTSVNTKKARWDGGEFVPVVPCPNCRNTIGPDGQELL